MEVGVIGLGSGEALVASPNATLLDQSALAARSARAAWCEDLGAN